jgi:hypothetical protein
MSVMDETSAVGFEAIVELEGSVDKDALREAWSRLAARHPILTCVRAGDTWQTVGEPPTGPDAVQPGHDNPPISLRVTPIEEGVRLTMFCNHVAFDGMASVVLMGDLREEYVAVLEGRAPRPVDWSSRTIEAAAVSTPSWRSLTATATRGSFRWWQAPVSTHIDPGSHGSAPASDNELMDLGPVLQSLAPKRRKYHWSTDAVLVGVLEKAWSSVFGPPEAESSWLVAKDLRPALGVVRGIGNLSVLAGTSIVDPRSDLVSIIDQIDAEMSTQSADLLTASRAGARWGSAAKQSLLAGLRKGQTLRLQRSLSNVGQLGDSLDSWGTASLSRVWFVGPLAHPPYTSFIAAGRESSTLVSVRTSPHWLTSQHARRLEQAALELI